MSYSVKLIGFQSITYGLILSIGIAGGIDKKTATISVIIIDKGVPNSIHYP